MDNPFAGLLGGIGGFLERAAQPAQPSPQSSDLSPFQQRMLGQSQPMSFQDVLGSPSTLRLGLGLMAAGQRMTPQDRVRLIAGAAESFDPAADQQKAQLAGLYQQKIAESVAEQQRQAQIQSAFDAPDAAKTLGLGLNPAQMRLLGVDGVTKILQQKAAANPLEDELKRAQINAYNNRPAPLSPYEEARQKSQAEYETRTQQADQIGLTGDQRKEFLATGKLTTGSGAAPTQDQANARTFYGMMETAEKQLSDPSIGPAATSRVQRAIDAAPYGLGRGFTSPEYQLAENAQRNFIAAYLRKTSGQNITDSEFEMHRPLFFPQPGETDPRVLAQKAQNRKDAMAGILGSAPLDYQREIKERQSQPAGGASGGSGPSGASPFPQYPGARQGNDGHWYVTQDGKHYRVDN